MRNILAEKPLEFEYLSGRTKYSCLFVDREDIENKRMLDIGCGFGWFELYTLRNNVNSIVGVEVSEKDLEIPRIIINDKKIQFRIGSALLLPFDDSSFDTVVAWEVIEHIPKKSEVKMFSEINRVLKNNGTFYLSTPYKSIASTLFDPAWWLIGHRHYSEKNILGYASETNFKYSKFSIKGKFWEVLSWWNLYVAKWFFRRKPFSPNFFNKKQNAEFLQKTGFANIFVKFKKNGKNPS